MIYVYENNDRFFGELSVLTHIIYIIEKLFFLYYLGILYITTITYIYIYLQYSKKSLYLKFLLIFFTIVKQPKHYGNIISLLIY